MNVFSLARYNWCPNTKIIHECFVSHFCQYKGGRFRTSWFTWGTLVLTGNLSSRSSWIELFCSSFEVSKYYVSLLVRDHVCYNFLLGGNLHFLVTISLTAEWHIVILPIPHCSCFRLIFQTFHLEVHLLCQADMMETFQTLSKLVVPWQIWAISQLTWKCKELRMCRLTE